MTFPERARIMVGVHLKARQMGREAQAQLTFRSETGRGRILLEATEILCRGAVRARVPRADVIGWQAIDDDLVLSTLHGPLTATLGAKEAAAWVRALAKPVPTLAEKLGIGADCPAFVVGVISDPVLGAAISAHCTENPSQARFGLAELRSGADLTETLARIGNLPLWAITVKGRTSPYPEAEMRKSMRALGYVDTKSCSVSAQMTATRWQKPKGPALTKP